MTSIPLSAAKVVIKQAKLNKRITMVLCSADIHVLNWSSLLHYAGSLSVLSLLPPETLYAFAIYAKETGPFERLCGDH